MLENTLIMHYENIVQGTFISRPNRFIAEVLVNGKKQTVHVKNTGRCKELLVPGNTVYLEKSSNLNRKTPYDLVTVEKKLTNGSKLIINMDSQAPNKIAEEWIKTNTRLFSEITLLKPEFTLGDSRFDFYIEYNKLTNGSSKIPSKMLMEVKGVTLEENGIAMFPDAPTERGLKHVKELTEYAASKTYDCSLVFIIQMKGCRLFKPNFRTHKEFGLALQKAQNAGVNIYAIDCIVSPENVTFDQFVEINLQNDEHIS